MLIFVKAIGQDGVLIDYQRANRPVQIESLQRGNPAKLSIQTRLENLGPTSFKEFQKVFGREAIHDNWYAETQDIVDLLTWARENKDARPVEFKHRLRKISKRQKHTSAVNALVESGGVQRRVCSMKARNDLADPCPECAATISEGEYFNEALGKMWHSMCAPKDKIVVGEWLDDDDELVKQILFEDEPTATEYISRKVGE